MHPVSLEVVPPAELVASVAHALANATRDCVITTDAAGIVSSWSAGAEELLGYSTTEAIGEPWSKFLTSGRIDWDQGVGEQLRSGQRICRSEPLLAKDGTSRTMPLVASPIQYRGAMVGVLIVLARPGAGNDREWRVARRLAAIVDTSDDAIVSKDLNGIVTSWNRAAEVMFGYSASEMVGQSIRRIIPSDRQFEEDDVLARVRRGEKIDHFETVRQRNDGTLVPISLTVSPIIDEDGTVIGASKIARDIRDRKRLAAIVDSSDDAIVSKTLEGVVTSWNIAAEKMFGFSADEMVGQSIRRIIPADRQQEEDDGLARIRRGEKIDHFETIRQRKDGSLLPISLTISPIRDERGTVVGASKIARDISDRKRAEAEHARLLEIAERNASITEKLNRVGALVASTLDRETVVQAVTDAATELTTAEFGAFFYNVVNDRGESYTLYTISGVPREAFAHFPMPRNTPVFEPTFRGTATVRSDDITRDPRYGRNPPHHGQPPGHLPVRSYLAVPVRSAEGRVLGGLFFGHSEVGRFTAEHESLVVGIAAWASVALENARLYRTAQEANRLKDDFLATLSHELRTPLNAILGYARMLRTGMLPDDKRVRAIETIERNGESLTQIVEDVLDISRIVAGKMRLNVQPVDLKDIVRRAVESVHPTADVKGVAVSTIFDPKAGLVAGDPERLQQVTWNLLTNAVKFTPAGGSVQVCVQPAEAGVAIAVRDTGVGIAPEFVPHLFERFRQADASTSRSHGGLGLGLAIVRQLVDMHGGTITGESDGLGKGATFTVKLPAMAGAAADGERGSPFTALPTPRLASLSGVRVLVVDDDADALAMVRDILEAAGASVTGVASADAALAHLAVQRPDVMVSDLGMPYVDGFELMARLRQDSHARGRGVPAAALTAYARSDERRRALLAGFQMHLSKPINPVELVEAVRTLSGVRPSDTASD
jgi:PAS domain S-box-containing protein